MRLNKKGYMLVELVLASVLAMSVALYLLNLTYEFKDKNEDIYQSITYLSDKTLITKNIMNDLDNLIVTSIEKNTSSNINNIVLMVQSKKTNNKEYRNIQIKKDNGITITYGKWNKSNNSFDTSDVSYYTKKLESSLIVSDIKIEQVNDNKYLKVEIPIKSMYTDDDYSIKLFIEANDVPKYLKDMEVGSYVSYVGSNGCSGDACKGQNINYVNSSNMGYCGNSNYKFNVSGWRIAYINDGSAYLVSAGALDCAALTTKKGLYEVDEDNMPISTQIKYTVGTGYSISGAAVSLTDVTTVYGYVSNLKDKYGCFDEGSYTITNEITCSTNEIVKFTGNTAGRGSNYEHYFVQYNLTDLVDDSFISSLNSNALKYCNGTYAYGGMCNDKSAWTMSDNDFSKITGKSLWDCSKNESDNSCYGSNLINNGGFNWFANIFDKYDSQSMYAWSSVDRKVFTTMSTSTAYGIRPVIRLKENVIVIGGSGTADDPYQISVS